MARSSAWRFVFPASLATGLSLLGDSALYTVLPTHLAAAGVAIGAVGILLSANRFIRLVLNGPMGLLTDRWPRRRVFVPAAFLGAFSTALYALTTGFWPLMLGRLLWGVAWAGIWVSGNTIVLDVTDHRNRGKWVGRYHTAFYLGAASGAILGGVLTDWLGYHRAMAVAASLTFSGAVAAWLFLPETTPMTEQGPAMPRDRPQKSQVGDRPQLISATALLAVNRMVMAGILFATFSLFLARQFGESVEMVGRIVGISSLTGLALGASTLIGMTAAPIAGALSDRSVTRWSTAASGLFSGILGFGLLALGSTMSIFLGLPLASISSGSNQGLSTAVIGDLSLRYQHGRRLGVFFTVGDLGSAIGPPVAYGLLSAVGLSVVYLSCAGLLGVMFFVALWWAIRPRQQTPIPG